MANKYKVNQTVRVTGTFTVSDTATDPTTVTVKVCAPNGTITSYTYAAGTVTKSATGIYYKDVSGTSAGKWFYRFEGTGAVAAASEDYFIIEASKFS